MYRPISASLILVVAALVVGCGDGNDPVDPDPVTPVQVTETNTGTLTVNGAVTHTFIAQQTGGVSVTLDSLSTTDAVVGLSLGTWNGTSQSCQTIIASDVAGQGRRIDGTATSTGIFCARVYDVGKLTGSVDYKISITHY
jgi:hypothetical protein